MSIFQPFAFQQGPSAAGGGWDPTLGGTVTPDYWWDLQDSSPSNMEIINTNQINKLYNKGSQTNGTLTSSLGGNPAFLLPTFGLDSLGKNAGNFVSGRLGSYDTLIPHLQNCTVFVAFNPTNGGGSTQQIFCHEGYTYSGGFSTVQRTLISKLANQPYQWITFLVNNVLYPVGTYGEFLIYSAITDTRGRPESATTPWIRAGVDELSEAQMYSTMHTQISTRDYYSPGTNMVEVQMAFDTPTMGTAVQNDFTPSTNPDEGTAIGQGGRPQKRDPYLGAVYTVVVYFQKLTQPQITQLYNGWNSSF